MKNENFNLSLTEKGLEILIDSLLMQERNLNKRIELLKNENFVSSQELDSTKELQDIKMLLQYLTSKQTNK